MVVSTDRTPLIDSPVKIKGLVCRYDDNRDFFVHWNRLLKKKLTWFGLVVKMVCEGERFTAGNNFSLFFTT